MFGLRDLGKKQAGLIVVGGRNLFKRSSGNIYKMVSEEKKHGSGVVRVKGRLYNLINIYKHEQHKRSAGKTAIGALGGGLIGGGVGAVLGGALGAKRKEDSIYEITLVDRKTNEEFTIQAKTIKGGNDLSEFPIYINE